MSKLFLLAFAVVAATASAATLRSAESLMVEVRALRAENAMLRAQNEVLLSDGALVDMLVKTNRFKTAMRGDDKVSVQQDEADKMGVVASGSGSGSGATATEVMHIIVPEHCQNKVRGAGVDARYSRGEWSRRDGLFRARQWRVKGGGVVRGWRRADAYVHGVLEWLNQAGAF